MLIDIDGKQSKIQTKKVILATGLTSQPNLPIYEGTETFGAPIYHAKDFCRNGDTVNTAEKVVVIRGAKSAMDVAYAYAEKGVKVDMVIRKEGNGPVWISTMDDLVLTVPMGGLDGWGFMRSFLHGTAVGRFIVEQFWGGLGGEVLEVNGYAKNAELKKGGLSIHNYDQDFFEMVKTGKIKVHSPVDVDHLINKTVHLTDGTALPADVLICATGWRKEPSVRFVNFGDAGIGSPQSKSEQASLSTKYDEKILRMYPKLRNQPELNFKPKNDPYRMYRFMVPPARYNDRNIASAVMVSSVSTAWAANIQALWISAYLDNRLDIEPKNQDDITKEVMMHTQWGKWRYPCGYGASLPDFVFDALPYMDLMLKDLGLKINRKKGWFADLTEPYGPEDFVGLVDETIEKHGHK